MKNKLFSGIMPALITPIHPDGTLMRSAAEAVIDWELSFPVRGFYINGATGEGPILPEATRREMAEVAVEKVRGRGAIINHIGAPDTNEAIRLARHAAEIGCDAISSVLPNFYFKYTTPQILDYYRRIGDASGLPIIVYANGLMNTDPVDFMREAIEIPEVAGVKYTIYDYYSMRRICELNGGDINVINGPDEMLAMGLAAGCDACIGTTYNFQLPIIKAIFKAFKENRPDEARELQMKADKIIGALISRNTIMATKLLMDRMGYDVYHAVFPMQKFSPEVEEMQLRELREAGFEF